MRDQPPNTDDGGSMDPEQIPTQVQVIRPPHEVAEPTSVHGSDRQALPPVSEALPSNRFAGFPKVGDHVEHCRLVAELGRGASGLVFLAEQDELAHRPIVLKITRDSREEHLRLARLQHTHIMPLYWAATLPFEGLHLLAMPYLARTTLVRLEGLLAGSPRQEWSGRRVADLLQGDQIRIAVPIALHEHPAAELKSSSWEQFIVRIGELLAETLAFVHRRGLVHLDLKPSNILITPDGMPILLDLDVACQPIPTGVTECPWIGGTTEYMSPEQRDAVAALKDGRPVPGQVDGRSDLFTLGLVMFSSLGGETDAAGKADFPRFRKERPEIPSGLVAILAKCLETNPWRRYPDGQSLADDLRRHAENRPLFGVREPYSERWRKWRKRRPWDLPVAAISAGFLIAAAVAGWLGFRAGEEQRRLAEAALIEGKNLQGQGLHDAAIRQFLAGKEYCGQSRGARGISAEFDERVRHSERILQAEELARAVRWMRFYALQEHPPKRLQWVMEAAARKIWARRDLLLDSSATIVEPPFEESVRQKLKEFVHLWVPLHVELAPPAHETAARSEADRILAEAEALLGPALAFDLARERLGQPLQRRHAPASSWEYCAVAREALRQGHTAEAEESVRAALALDPRGFVSQLHRGIVAMQRREYDLAARAFSFCAGQDPQPECFVLRGEALARQGQNEQALEDYSQAIALNGELVAAYTLRAELLRKLGRTAEAEADEQRASHYSD